MAGKNSFILVYISVIFTRNVETWNNKEKTETEGFIGVKQWAGHTASVSQPMPLYLSTLSVRD